MAQAAAVTTHLGELALRALGTRAGQLASQPVSQAQLDDAADLTAGMRAAWHQVDHLWDTMITESRLLPTPAMTETSDLVLRMGRLVWDDPHWTPAHPRPAPMRTPDTLAPRTDAVTTVIAAVHQSVDALARTAEADTSAVQAAGQARRLLSHTVTARGLRRSPPLRDRSGIPMPGTGRGIPRCPERQHPGRASARRACHRGQSPQQDAGARPGSSTYPVPSARQPAPARRLRSRRPAARRQPVHAHPRTCRQARTSRAGHQAAPHSNPVMLLRAAAIDSAARRLITQAENATHGPDSPDTPANRPRVAGSAAQLAALSFPRDLATRPAAGQPPRPPPRQ